MKTITNLGIGLVALMMGLSSCYKDEGNYDYITLPETSLQADKETEEAGVIYATQFTTFELPITMTGNENDYTYSWRIWPNTVLGTDKQKEISTSKDLSFEVNELPGQYTLLLTCQHKQHKVNTYKQFTLVVQSVITEGWMVLHEKDGKTDFDLIMTPYFSKRVKEDNILHNVYESINGEPLPGRGVSIGSYMALGRYQDVTILTDKGGARLDAITMQRKFDMATLMPDMSDWKPERYIYYEYYWGPGGRGYDAIISNGQYYTFCAVPGADLLPQYTAPIVKEGLEYKASPYVARYFDYYMGLFYDELHGRFLCFPEVSWGNGDFILRNMPDDASGAVCNVNDMHASLRYMETGFKNYEWGLFKDWNTHENILYGFNFDDRKGVDKEKYVAKNCPALDEAKYFAIGKRGPVFFYATDTDIYQYDYQGSNTGKKVYSLANAAEKITGMKIYKPCHHKFIPNHPFDNKVLIFSTYNEAKKEGKIYMYYINESNGSIDMSSEKVVDGFGEILDMDYNFAKYGS